MRKFLFISAILLAAGTPLNVIQAQVNVKPQSGKDAAIRSTKNNKTIKPEPKAIDRNRWHSRSEAIRSLGAKERSATGETARHSILSANISAAPQRKMNAAPALNKGSLTAKSTKAALPASPPSSRPKATTPPAPPVRLTMVPTVSAASPEIRTSFLPGAPSLKNNVAGATNSASETTSAANLINLYRVGVDDVLDIRLLNTTSPRSTLYTVLAGGLLRYPPAGEPIAVAGMTTDEIAVRLTTELQKRAGHKAPKIMVSVREYASHTLTVNGLVTDPGEKIIQREAIPLYVVIADAQPRPEAGRVLITSKQRSRSTEVDLADQSALRMLVQPGDVINVLRKVPRFYYIDGEVNQPGQKEFHAGITLTQAVLAAGSSLTPEEGASKTLTREVTGGISSRSKWSIAKVTRRDADGRLTTTAYNLKEIISGSAPDPLLQPGDRVEISH